MMSISQYLYLICCLLPLTFMLLYLFNRRVHPAVKVLVTILALLLLAIPLGDSIVNCLTALGYL